MYKFLRFPYFLFFLVLHHDFIMYIDLPISQLQSQQLMTLHIRSYIDYLIRTYYYVIIIKIGAKSSLVDDF